jgi:hypothetical protein
MIAERKPGNAIELQTPVSMNSSVDPGKLRIRGSMETPALLVGVKSGSDVARSENNAEQDLQTDNAISVLALNDRNKAIAGFFKKLTSRAPADETAENSKKLRVSVFQFSY